MQLIHLFWQATSNGFDNTGKMYAWLESAKPLRANAKCKIKPVYPYQLIGSELEQWFAKQLKLTGNSTTLKVNLPVDQVGQAIPSPVIANINELEQHECAGLQRFGLNVLEIAQPLTWLKELSFQQHYFPDDIQLADDSLFWLDIAQLFSQMIKQDQYIPSVLAFKDSKKTQFTSGWQTLSSVLQDHLQTLSQQMPFAACLGEFTRYKPLSALRHFCEVELNRVIASTSFAQKHLKQVEDTFIHHNLSLDLKDKAAKPDNAIWQTWKLWQNNLSYDQFGAAFQLALRLVDASSAAGEDWQIEVLLQSKADPSYRVSLAEFWQNKHLANTLYNDLLGTSIERVLLLQLGYASRLYPPLEQIFSTNMQQSCITLNTQQAFQFLKEEAWPLHACGYHIMVPAWWTSKGRLRAKTKLRASKSQSSSAGSAPDSYFDQDTLMDFDYQYAMGDHDISADEWQQLIDSKSELVYFRGNWVEINQAEMAKMQQLIDSSRQDGKQGKIKDLLQMAADEDLYDIELEENVEAMLEHLTNKDSLSLLTQPQSLNATLRPYQVRGLSWLAYLENLGMNPCLADDMGLGKTMQVISLLLSQPRSTPALLIAPTSVVGNWFKELEKFAPSLNAHIHHGAKRKQQGEFSAFIQNFDIVITSYGLIRQDKALFTNQHWSRVIIDEAQNIKNPTSAQTKVIFGIPADSRLAITGTPIENRLLDLWSIFNFLNPGFLGARAEFKKQFELPVQRDNDQQKTNLLKKLVEPFILRRLKTDKSIVHDLPDKIEQKVYCELTKEQASIYQSIVEEIKQDLAQSEDDSPNSIYLSALLRLKQCCNHPAQVLQDGSEFSIERSVKLQRLTEMAKEVIDNRESMLIFSQFKEVCSELVHVLKSQFGYQVYYLHGGTSRQKREEMIEQFQADNTAPSIFVLSLKAGGVGITLTKANHVIHFDRWWNPAVENQATDRAYRIGQQKTVFAHKFITLGTIEERIDEMLTEKQKVSDSIVGSDESWLTQLDPKSFIQLIQLSQANT
ncbi:DEAD/DEAH box helicase [Algibacillus agarilyticus]|uniref:DEAD/DEAH box helicase n=1 Tax=Algibacillus agarilyticus TaxID=2234133 RepID=UPI000DD06E54|nr:DEAD/DEAH box helicase [Algibacillus agarilyticus]